MTYTSKMILAQIKAEAVEEENKRKRHGAIMAAINVARLLADQGVLRSMKHSVDEFGEHLGLGLTLAHPTNGALISISFDIRDAQTLDALMQMLKTFYPEMRGVFDQAMREK